MNKDNKLEYIGTLKVDKTSIVCPSCGGTGKRHYARYKTSDGEVKYEKDTCHDCGGTGITIYGFYFKK